MGRRGRGLAPRSPRRCLPPHRRQAAELGVVMPSPGTWGGHHHAKGKTVLGGRGWCRPAPRCGAIEGEVPLSFLACWFFAETKYHVSRLSTQTVSMPETITPAWAPDSRARRHGKEPHALSTTPAQLPKPWMAVGVLGTFRHTDRTVTSATTRKALAVHPPRLVPFCRESPLNSDSHPRLRSLLQGSSALGNNTQGACSRHTGCRQQPRSPVSGQVRRSMLTEACENLGRFQNYDERP